MLLLLDPYVDVILALALAYLSLQIVKALFGPLGGLPVVGGAIVALEQTISRSVAHACGTIFAPVDTAIGKSLAGIAGLVTRIAGYVREVARVIFGTAELAASLAYAYSGIRSLAHELHRGFAGIEAGVKTLERAFHGIEHRVRTIEHTLAQGIGNDVRSTVHDLTKEVTHIERRALPAIRGDIATAEGEIGNLFDWIRGKADIIGAGTFIGAITAALALVGNGWLGCKENPFSSSKKPCSLWGDLARFMPLLGLLVIAFDFEEFTDAAELLAQGIGDSVASIEGTFVASLPPLPPPA